MTSTNEDSQRPLEPGCPGLRASERWDRPSALRGELYTAERLAEHAIELAHAHGVPSKRGTPGPLRQRFSAAKGRIREAYDILAKDEHARRDPSPAEEWLLDNSHVVDDQIREIHEDLPWGYLVQLPRLSHGTMRGYPRVYALCLDYLRHTDAHLDLATLAGYVRAYQSVHDLTIGELWAVPIMLRLGLILVVGALASSEASAQDRARADEFADSLFETGAGQQSARSLLKKLEKDEGRVNDAFLVQLLRRLREHDAPDTEVTEWIRAQCARKDTTPEELARKQHLRQAADQVSVGNSITSMRAIAALDWNKFFEQVSSVESVLLQDPSGAHVKSDQATRDRCRHAVERLARRSSVSEADVARAALERARAVAERAGAAAAGGREVAESHVGYYLVDRGRRELERYIDYRPTLGEWLMRPVLAYPALFYLGFIFCATLVIELLLWRLGFEAYGGSVALVGLILGLLPASEVAVSLANTSVVTLLKPRLLPKLSFDKGLPEECATLVVVPSLLDNEATVRELLEDLEVRSFANPEANLYFALLTDFTDSAAEETPEDQRLLALAVSGIAALNQRYTGREEHRFWLLHRRRVHNPVQGCFMGWERKRGKLEELNRWLRGATDTTFSFVSGPAAVLRRVRYVITLDADTELPRDVARRLIGTAAHPLNRPVVDPLRRRVVRGHGILQPRVGTLPLSSRRSRFARIFAGPPGIDPYTTAVSDAYQDLFGEGSFVGKGLYDVDAFAAVTAERVPENRLLSHDLFEGNLARSALVTDIEVLDEQPATYAVVASRQHRWMRGDWQLLPWLLPRVPSAKGGRSENPFSALDLWKVYDNLRRSLTPVALVGLLIWGFFAGRRASLAVGALALLVFLAPLVCRLVLDALRGGDRLQSRLGALGGDLKTNGVQACLNLVFLLDQAFLSLDAITRTLFRVFVSRRRLLEWTTMSQASRSRRFRYAEPRMWLAAGVAVLLGLALWLAGAPGIWFGIPLLVGWAAAPLVAFWLGTPEKARDRTAELDANERRLLRGVARKTWRFFETFVNERENFLPPDNYQEDPRGVVAHRTSPTNIGLYLLSVVAARDFGYVALKTVLDRLNGTLSTIERMERRNGHILNWYETTTLRPLEPQYVSTVDSGNFAAYLWTLREACADLCATPLFGTEPLEAARDALYLAVEHGNQSKQKNVELLRKISAFDRQLQATAARISEPNEIFSWKELRELEEAAALLAATPAAQSSSSEFNYWLEQAHAALHVQREELQSLLPFVERLQEPPAALRVGDAAELFAQLSKRWSWRNSLNELTLALSDGAEQCETLRRAIGASPAAAQDQALAVAYVNTLEQELSAALRNCRALIDGLGLLGARAGAFGDAMDFRFLFDEERCLFSIGYNVGSMRLDGSHYDLLASEARLASLFAVAKGDAPQEHWFRSGRPRTVVGSHGVLLSWSGSMFEYLMPLLVTSNYTDSLLDQTYDAAVFAQRRYGTERGVPWGVSEAAYNVMDLGMTYQYRAFGVPGLGLKAGLAEDLVVAPYATALAAMVDPRAATQNFRALSKEGLEGPYGFYESIDYTPSHLPPGRRGVVVKALFAHHQGMALVALDNVLHKFPMVRRFHAEPRIKASALMLDERAPTTSPVVEVRATQIAAPPATEPEVYTAEHVGLTTPGNRVHLLGHGELSTLVTALGGGAMGWKQLDVNRFREDAALDSGGVYVYVRDHTKRQTWSSAYLPTRTTPSFYDAAFHIDRVAFHRRDQEIETLTEIVCSPEHPAEVRRITLTNHGESAHEVDVTAYMEVVLAPRVADIAHPAFSGMFIETEALPARGALIARRRPRSATEAPVWVVQVLSPENEGFGELEFDTSRSEFIGRGRSVAAPAGMDFDAALSGSVGMVLDPAFVLRRKVRIESGARVSLTLTTALASSREAALELIEIHATPHHAARTFGLAFADARVELKHLGITATQSHRFQRLLSAVVFPNQALRAAIDPGNIRGHGKGALWGQGISGDLPIVVLRIDDAEFHEVCRELLLAHEFFRLNGFSMDLVLLNEEPAGYLTPMQDAVRDLVRNSPAEGHVDQRGGVFIRRAGLLGEEDRAILLSTARVVLRASQGTLSQQLRRAAQVTRPLPKAFTPTRPARALSPARKSAITTRVFDNGFGGFQADGREYAMDVTSKRRPPAPWCNVMANERFGSVVTEAGGGATYFGNGQRHRLTPWSNDATSDPPGEIVYVRDDEDGSCWSLTPAPAGGDCEYRVRHGAGYTIFEHDRGELAHELTLFVSHEDPVKLSRVRLTNRSPRARRLSVYGVVEWVLGGSREASRATTMTQWDPGKHAVFALNPWSPFPERRAVYFSTHNVSSMTADREEFYGRAGSRAEPAALGRVGLSGQVGFGLDPCAALQLVLELPPNGSVELAFGLADAEGPEHARRLVEKYADVTHVQSAFQELTQQWDRVLGSISVRTPDPSFDLLVNRWLLYQALSCRIWARMGFYQSSGAYGYRDQLQDVLSLLHSRPDLAREHILRAAGRQFVEGDVQHWWHPESGEGIRSRCSDDLIWLPFATAEYVNVTGDSSILEEKVPFLEERQLAPGENDIFNSPATSHESFSLYEHCARALNAGATEGPHGLPTMRGGDWNDGMNRVGRGGAGESVWLAWFLAKTLKEFSTLAKQRGDRARIAFCAEHIDRLREAVETHAWDGAWYRRAFFDDGTPLGSQQNSECQIDAIAQSWAVIAGIGDPQRAARAVRSSEERLIVEEHRLMQLLTPPFQQADPDPGYIRSYPAGIRENGGQYTHGVLWTVVALCLQGEGDRAYRLFSMLNPINHALTADDARLYKVEPYVVAADVYSSPQHFGRGGWTWYTGSAAWMYRDAVESILGIRKQADRLHIAPCIPTDWRSYEVTYRYGRSALQIKVENPARASGGVQQLSIDDVPETSGSIPLIDDGKTRRVRVVLGQRARLGKLANE